MRYNVLDGAFASRVIGMLLRSLLFLSIIVTTSTVSVAEASPRCADRGRNNPAFADPVAKRHAVVCQSARPAKPAKAPSARKRSEQDAFSAVDFPPSEIGDPTRWTRDRYGGYVYSAGNTTFQIGGYIRYRAATRIR